MLDINQNGVKGNKFSINLLPILCVCLCGWVWVQEQKINTNDFLLFGSEILINIMIFKHSDF